jgi:hypothetical protein
MSHCNTLKKLQQNMVGSLPSHAQYLQNLPPHFLEWRAARNTEGFRVLNGLVKVE